ncbi:MAG TPA: hypothetical protein VH482_13140 [Thermomicrobiales bacterium]|jgi:hypothetical protein
MTDALQKAAAHESALDGLAGTLTFDEIIERHRGDWVLMRITEYNEDAWPERGYLLDVAPTQEEILEAWTRWAPEVSDGKGWPLYMFLAEPDISSGPEYEAAVREFFVGLLQAGGIHDAESG